jgi:RNA polymerase sigma-70 factor (ECF subfamily)
MDRDLVERAMSGDHDAFSELARVSVGRLLVIARLILHDEPAAEDATQEALVAAWRHIRGLRDPARFEAWLHRLLINACHREARKDRSRHSREVHLPTFDAPQRDATGLLLDRDQLDRGFRRLDVDHRAVIVLYYYLGLRPEEAADILGLPPGTVRSRLHRAMQQMRAALEADARTDPVGEGRTA